MISEKLKNSEEKKTFIEKNLKIIFLAVFILLVSPNLVKASCVPSCRQTDVSGYCTTENPVNECNEGVTSCCDCGWIYNVNCNDVGYICKSGDCLSTGAWLKCNKFPDTGDYNGRLCTVYSSGPLGPLQPGGCIINGQGVWDASEKKCVQCNGKVESKVCGSAGTVSTDTCNAGLTYCISTGCNVAGNGKCETACDVSVSSKCDDKTTGDPCGTGGTCDANCQCVGEVLPCGNGSCDVAGGECSGCPADCTVTDCCGNGVCNSAVGENSTNCLGDCPLCESTCTCACPTEIPCPGGKCKGGLVPCGRSCDDPCTKECECAPCTLCHLFVLFKRIVDFLTLNIIFPLAVLMIVVGGVMFLTAGGDPGRIGGAKKILTATVIGLAIILAAWLIVDTVITFLTPAGSPFQNWSTINCPVCGDGNCESGETPENCPADCGAPVECPNGTCNVAGGECTTCPADCNVAACCGNGTCDAAVGETSANCPADCGAPAECPNGTCNVAGGECTTCPADCNVAACCGNGVCDVAVGETNANCPADCAAPAECPNGACNVAGGECTTCPADCNVATCCGNGVCDVAVGETNANCPADCHLPGCPPCIICP